MFYPRYAPIIVVSSVAPLFLLPRHKEYDHQCPASGYPPRDPLEASQPRDGKSTMRDVTESSSPAALHLCQRHGQAAILQCRDARPLMQGATESSHSYLDN